jgi:hypothetical protein
VAVRMAAEGPVRHAPKGELLLAQKEEAAKDTRAHAVSGKAYGRRLALSRGRKGERRLGDPLPSADARMRSFQGPSTEPGDGCEAQLFLDPARQVSRIGHGRTHPVEEPVSATKRWFVRRSRVRIGREPYKGGVGSATMRWSHTCCGRTTICRTPASARTTRDCPTRLRSPENPEIPAGIPANEWRLMLRGLGQWGRSSQLLSPTGWASQEPHAETRSLETEQGLNRETELDWRRRGE